MRAPVMRSNTFFSEVANMFGLSPAGQVSEQGFAVLGKTAGNERQGSGEFVQGEIPAEIPQ